MTDELQQDSAPARVPKKRARSRGQSMVEFAMVLPLMLGFLVIAADFGRAFTAYLTVSSAAREGAVYASRSSSNATDEDEIEERTLDEVGPSHQIWGEDLDVDSGACSIPDPQGYQCVEVTVDYTFEPMFAVWPIPDDVPMQRIVRMRVLGS